MLAKLRLPLLAALAALSLGVLFSACGDDDEGVDDRAKATTGAGKGGGKSFLYVMDAGSGALKESDGSWTLTLKDVSPRVLYFSDRPDRAAGQSPLNKFVESWTRIFANDPPNAAIQELDSDDPTTAEVVELRSRPSYDSENDELKYGVKPVEDGQKPVPELGALSMFIDAGFGDAGGELGTGCTPWDPRCKENAVGCTITDPRNC